MRIKVPSISDNEAIEAFITGLCFHDVLRDKLLRKRPKSVTTLLATTKKYADADDAKKIIIEEAGRAPRSAFLRSIGRIHTMAHLCGLESAADHICYRVVHK